MARMVSVFTGYTPSVPGEGRGTGRIGRAPPQERGGIKGIPRAAVWARASRT